MQSGRSHKPVVTSLKGQISFYRKSLGQYFKAKAHRAHRHRVKADLGTLVDFETLDDAPDRSEQLTSWKFW